MDGVALLIVARSRLSPRDPVYDHVTTVLETAMLQLLLDEEAEGRAGEQAAWGSCPIVNALQRPEEGVDNLSKACDRCGAFPPG